MENKLKTDFLIENLLKTDFLIGNLLKWLFFNRKQIKKHEISIEWYQV